MLRGPADDNRSVVYMDINPPTRIPNGRTRCARWWDLGCRRFRLEAAERGPTAQGDGDRPRPWCLFHSAHPAAL